MKRAPLKRKIPLRPNSYAAAVARYGPGLRRKAPSSGPKPKPRATLGAGRKVKEWQAVWKELKPRFERAGITRCEFNYAHCMGGAFLTPAHSRKRRNITTPEKLREVAIACVHCHNFLELLKEAEMERRVCAVIAARHVST